jgi:hypothetical protein
MVGKPDVAAFEAGKRKGIGGDAGHGRCLRKGWRRIGGREQRQQLSAIGEHVLTSALRRVARRATASATVAKNGMEFQRSSLAAHSHGVSMAVTGFTA